MPQPPNSLTDAEGAPRSYTGLYVDLHRHGEANAWLDPLVADLEHRERHDWARWRTSLAGLAPGTERLAQLVGPMPNEVRNAYLDQPRFYNPVLRACLGAAADSGCSLAEFRLGAAAATESGFIDRFRAAEASVRERHPEFVAVPVVSGFWPNRGAGQQQLEALLATGAGDFAAVDFIPFPYEETTDWEPTYRAAERLSAAGFGITIHAGEFTPLHLVPALECPGVTRIGHGTQLREEPTLLQQVVDRGIVLEVCLTSNVLLGAVESLEAHPLRQFLESGARVVLSTDNPARFGTTIAEEYALAARLSLTNHELATCTRTAIDASFCHPEDKKHLLASLQRGHTPSEARP